MQPEEIRDDIPALLGWDVDGKDAEQESVK